MLNRWVWAVVLVVLGVVSVPAFTQPATFRFDFGPGPVGEGMTRILPEMIYSDAAGFGFEPGVSITAVDRGGDDPVTGDFCTAKEPFFFSVAVPEEGNFRVTVTLGDRQAESVTTIKAELRRLMVQEVRTAPGQFEKVSFIVNTRTPKIAAVGDIRAGEVRLKAPRETTQEAWAWDNRLTLEFGNSRPAVCAVEIVKVDVPTIFLLGDTHHNNYGSYELAKCIVQGIRDNKLGIAKDIVDDFKSFDPAHPDPLEAFTLPGSLARPSQRPLGN